MLPDTCRATCIPARRGGPGLPRGADGDRPRRPQAQQPPLCPGDDAVGGIAALCAGAGGLVDPFTGKIPGDVQAQTAQSIENLKAILEAAGSSLPQVMKTTVFIKNMDDFSKVNEVYAKYFPNNPSPTVPAWK